MTAGIKLFDRVCEVTINTIKLTGHRVYFHIEKTLRHTPNVCTVKVWNLREDQRSELEQIAGASVGGPKKVPKLKVPGATALSSGGPGVPVKIEAGFKEGTSQIWLGDLRFVESIRDGTDWITEISTGDGKVAYQTARVSLNFGPKTQIDTAIRAMVRALGVGEGNVSTVAAKLRLSGFGKILAHGAVVSGSAARQMNDWARSADLEWSIQDGAIQFVDRGKSLVGQAIKISSDTGMYDSPTVDSQGIVTVKTALIPDVRAGGLMVLDADRIKGNYLIEKATWEGDTFDEPWWIILEGKRY